MLNQPMSSPMMNRMFGFLAWACTAPATPKSATAAVNKRTQYESRLKQNSFMAFLSTVWNFGVIEIHSVSNEKTRFQSFFMLMTVQPFDFASSYSACVNAPTLVSGKPVRRAVGVFALRVIVQHEHHQPGAVAGTGVLQHLLVARRVAERRVRPAADHQMNALGLARIVVVQQQLGFLGEKRPAVLVVAVFRSARRADDLLGRDAVDASE